MAEADPGRKPQRPLPPQRAEGVLSLHTRGSCKTHQGAALGSSDFTALPSSSVPGVYAAPLPGVFAASALSQGERQGTLHSPVPRSSCAHSGSVHVAKAHGSHHFAGCHPVSRYRPGAQAMTACHPAYGGGRVQPCRRGHAVQGSVFLYACADVSCSVSQVGVYVRISTWG